MKEFDHEGLILAEFQGKLFEKSYELNCSSPIFFRRFLHSELLKQLDKNRSSAFSLDVNEGISLIVEQYGDSKYGQTKIFKKCLILDRLYV